MAWAELLRTVCDANGWTTDGTKVEIALPSDRKQVVAVELFSHEGEEMARIWSNVGSADALSETRLRAAFGINYQLPHGALAIREGHLVMADTFLVSDADQGEVEQSMRNLASTADKYERLIYGTDQH